MRNGFWKTAGAVMVGVIGGAAATTLFARGMAAVRGALAANGNGE